MTVQYLIDSENVGDFWISLLELPGEQTELIVFYTRNSPHMSYESLIKLKESDRTVTFIKCYEGTNALDFQLVTELGYRISKNESDRFVIVTNDTGFDAAVKYWRRSKKSVKRITGKECKNLERRRREDLEWRNASVRTRENVSIPAETGEETETAASTGSSPNPEEMQDVRPSRPVLRDAETAAEPEAEETEFEEESFDDIPDHEETDYETDFEEEEDDMDEMSPDEMFSDELSPDGMSSDEVSSDGMSPDEMSPDEMSSDEISSDDLSSDEMSMSADDKSMHEDSDKTVSDEGFDSSDYSDAEYSDEEAVSQDEDNPEPAPGPDYEKQDIVRDIQKPDSSKTGAGIESGLSSPVSETEDRMEKPGPLKESLPKDGISGLTISESHENTDSGDAAQGNDASSAANHSALPASENSDAKETPAAEDSAASGSVSGTETAKKKKAVSSNPDVSEDNQESADSGQGTDDQAADSPRRTRSRRSRSRRTKSGSKKAESIENPSENSSSEDQKSPKSTAKSPNTEAAPAESSGAAEAEGNVPEASRIPGDEEIARIVACIGPDNLAELHNQLATFYGDQGKDIYLSIKNNTRSIPVLKPDLKQKFEYYCEIIFARSDYTGEYPADISEYLLSVREKLNNLTSLRYALLKHYGKEKGRRFYFLLKPFAKTMYQM